MTKKIVISKPGYDAKTETDINNLIFSSDYNTFKYYATGTVTIHVTADASSSFEDTSTVTHNLGYRPFFMVYAKDSDTLSRYAPVGLYMNSDMSHDGSARTYQAGVSGTKLKFTVTGMTFADPTDFTVTFKYKIFKNKLGI